MFLRNAPRVWALVPVFAALVSFGPLTIDLVLPFLPGLQHDLDVSAATAQLVVTGATFGFAIGQVIAGPLSDAVGRRPPLVVAAVLHVGASVVAALTSDMAILLPARFVQGAACTAAGVVVIAIVRDLYAGRRLVTMLANLGVVTSVTPLLVPAVGAQLTRFMDWRGSFVVVAAWGVCATVAAIVLLPETLPPERRHPGGLGPSLRASGRLLRQPRLLALAAGAAAGWAIGFGYLATAPFLYLRVFDVGPDLYGLLFLVTSIVTFGAAQLSGRVLVPGVGGRRVMILSGAITAVGAVALCTVAVVGPRGLLPVVIAQGIGLAGRALSFPAVQFLALRGPANQAGSVSALLGAVSFTVAGIVMPIVGGFAEQSLVPLALLMGVGAAVILAVGCSRAALPRPADGPDEP